MKSQWKAFVVRAIALLGLALVASAGTGRWATASAQDAPVVFVHGFRSGGQAWAATANDLSSRLQITTLTPTTNWSDVLESQSMALRDALNAWGHAGVIDIAHSNGGLNSRAYAQALGTASLVNRLVTVGTPHTGAPIAGNVLNGRMVQYFGAMTNTVAGTINFYAANDPDWDYGPVIDFFTQNALGWVANVGQVMADNSALIGLGFGRYIPVINEDVPGSPFLNNLNGGGMATENAAFQYRIGISTQVSPYGIMFALLTSDPDRARRVRDFAAGAALDLYLYYRDHPDPYLASQAYRWYLSFLYIYNMDVAWHDFIGAIRGFGGSIFRPVVYIDPSDGFIPGPRSQYPGANEQRNLYLPSYSVPHTGQMGDPSMRAVYENILTQKFGVAYRSAPPPPPDPPPGSCPDPTQIVCTPP